MNMIKKWGKRVLIGVGILSFLLIALVVLVPSESTKEVARVYATPVPATMTSAVVSATYTPYPTPEPLPTYTLYPTEALLTLEPTLTLMPESTMEPTTIPTLEPTVSLAEIYRFSEQEQGVMRVVYDGVWLLCAARDSTIDGFLSSDASLQNTSFYGMGIAQGIIIIDLENVNLDGAGTEVLDMYNAMLTAMRDGFSLCELGTEITAKDTVVPFSSISGWLDVIETTICPMLNSEPLVWFE